jgi:hypothetical protein
MKHKIALYIGFVVMLIGLSLGQSHPSAAQSTTTQIFLPIANTEKLWLRYGVETINRPISEPAIQQRAAELGVVTVRVNSLSWRAVQPDNPQQFNEAALAAFEKEVLSARQIGLEPLVVLDDAPRWATVVPSSCAAIKDQHLGDMARFAATLVERYRNPPYSVRYWELGNEVDVDPTIVGQDSPFGCWGDINDPYYGGERYGRMLKVVTPAMKQVYPGVQVLHAGLLLGSPDSDPKLGSPQKFFEGVLRAGGGEYFDILPFHSYPFYLGPNIDYEFISPAWNRYGGFVVGKTRFLREVMARYGVQKPMWMNEGGLVCHPDYYNPCGGEDQQPPDAGFYNAQANHAVRMFTRGWAEGIELMVWFSIDGPGWFYGGLLTEQNEPTLTFAAYREFVRQTFQSNQPFQIPDYGQAVDAYRFVGRQGVTDLLWGKSQTPVVVEIDANLNWVFYRRDGTVFQPEVQGSKFRLAMTLDPVYIQRR